MTERPPPSVFALPTGRAWTPPLQTQLQEIADPVWLFNAAAGRMLWGNRATLALWHVATMQALQAIDPTEGWSAPARQRLNEVITDVQQGAVSVQALTLFPTANRGVDVELLLVATTLADGKPGMLCRARSAGTRAATSRGVEALDHTGIMVTTCTLDGRVLMENAAAQRTYGFIDRAVPDAIVARFEIPLEGRRARAQLERGLSFSAEVQMNTRHGLRWHAVGIHLAEDPVTHLPCTVIDEQDITELKNHERDLEVSRAELENVVRQRTSELAVERDHFEQVFDSVGALILVADETGTIVRVNQWAQSLFRGKDLAGRTLHEVCGFPDPDSLGRWVLRNEAPADPVEAVLQPDGDRRCHVLWTPRLATQPDGHTRLLLTGIDITELRQVESQLQVTDRLATMGTLAEGVAHDLNNPLAYVITNAEVVLEEVKTLGRPDLATMLEDAIEGARRAGAIVAQLQAFARGSAGERQGAAHLASVVEFAARMAHNQIRHRAHIQVRCPQGLHAHMKEADLGLVVLNLLVHACDRMEPGEASRHVVHVEGQQAEPGWLTLSVQDDGPGLSGAELRRVFDPYTPPHTPPRGITGLGLSMSQRLIHEAGGRVEVQSAGEHGTRVVVWLPQAQTDERSHSTDAPDTEARSSGAERAADAKRRILLIDDEAKLRSVMRRALRAYHIDEAADGRQALERLSTESYDVILCDLMMPELTGVELYNELVERSPEMAARIIFMSGGAYTPGTADFLQDTVQPVIDKPFRMADLKDTIAGAIEAHDAKKA